EVTGNRKPATGNRLLRSAVNSFATGLRTALTGIESHALFHQAAQLLDRLGIVVHLQAQDDVVVQPDAAVLLHDQQRRRLLAAGVAAGCLPASERGDKAD